MKKVSQISFYTGSREELLPGFTSKFPYISSCSDITKHPGHFLSLIHILWYVSGEVSFRLISENPSRNPF